MQKSKYLRGLCSWSYASYWPWSFQISTGIHTRDFEESWRNRIAEGFRWTSPSSSPLSGLKLLSKVGQLKVMTAADHRHIMKIVIFALDDIFEKWNNITCNELCDLYAKFSKMYIMSREESYTESELKVFEVIILV